MVSLVTQKLQLVLMLVSYFHETSSQLTEVRVVLLNTSTMTYMVYLGISVASTVRVGLAVGSGRADKAKIAAKVGAKLTFLNS